MREKIYLTSGHISNKTKALDQKIFCGLNGDPRKILVIDWAKDGFEQRGGNYSDYRKLLRMYFQDLGMRSLEFASELDNGIQEKLRESNLIYLLGGDLNRLNKELNKNNIRSNIKSFKGILIGNGRGAYALSNGYIKIREVTEIINSENPLVPFWIKCHYTENFDSKLKKLSADSTINKIYAIPDGSALVYDPHISNDDYIEHLNSIYLFLRGEKIELK
ncbi:MAG: Type 1 glutamine amidotransferase-like domain-containing protein [Nanoarchaeota archaeon]